MASPREQKSQANLERASISFSHQASFSLSPFHPKNNDEGNQTSPRMPSMRVPSKSSLRPSAFREEEEEEEEEDDDGDPLGLFDKKGKRRPSGLGFGGGNVKLSRLEILDMINGGHRTYEAPKHRPRETLVEKLRQQNLAYLQDTSLVTTRRLNAFNSKANEQASKLEQQQMVVQNATSALSGALSLKLDVGLLSDNLAKTCLNTVGRISVVDRHQVKLKNVRSQLESLQDDSDPLADANAKGSKSPESPSRQPEGPSSRRSRSSVILSNLSAFAAMVNERQEREKEEEDSAYPFEWQQESQELLLRGPRERTTIPPPAPKAKSTKKKGTGKKKTKKVEKALQPTEVHPILRVEGPPAPFHPSIRDLNDRTWEARSADMISSLIKKNPGLTSFEEARKESSRAANISARAKRFLEVSNLLPKDTLVGQQLNRKLTEIRYTRPFLKFPEPAETKI